MSTDQRSTAMAYPIPHDGPVGRLLEAADRSPMRASHLHFMVSADAVPPVAGGKSGRLREAYLYVWV